MTTKKHEHYNRAAADTKRWLEQAQLAAKDAASNMQAEIDSIGTGRQPYYNWVQGAMDRMERCVYEARYYTGVMAALAGTEDEISNLKDQLKECKEHWERDRAVLRDYQDHDQGGV